MSSHKLHFIKNEWQAVLSVISIAPTDPYMSTFTHLVALSLEHTLSRNLECNEVNNGAKQWCNEVNNIHSLCLHVHG